VSGYNRGQMVIPAKARKGAGIGEGDVLAVEIQGEGKWLLVRLDRPKPFQPIKARIRGRWSGAGFPKEFWKNAFHKKRRYFQPFLSFLG
jgi:AbrB family looped-hinge helix DNA binding protein